VHWPWHVVLIPTAAIFNVWTNAHIPIGDVVRPLFIAVVAALSLLGVLALATRRLVIAGLIVTTITIILLSWAPVQVVRNAAALLTPGQVWILAALAAGTVGVGIRIALRTFERSPWSANLNRWLNAGAIVLLSVVVLRSLTSVVFEGERSAAPRALGQLVTVPSAALPDIYVILLDGYPREDVVEERFGSSNEEFVGQLESRGFEVAAASRSNYAFTLASLASTFDMRYVTDARLVAEGDSRSFSDLIQHGVVWNELRAAGYRITTVAPPFPEAEVSSADEVREVGGINEFEYATIQDTYVLDILSAAVPGFIPSLQRDAVADAFDQAARLVNTPTTGPMFAFIHVASPHESILINADGSARIPADPRHAYAQTAAVVGISSDQYALDFMQQLQYLDEKTLGLIDAILNSSGRAKAVVVMSDHGFRDWTVPDDHLTPAELKSRFSTLFAARTPGHPGLFGDEPSNVNLFRRLFSAYLDVPTPDLPYRAWVALNNRFEEVHPPNGG
jgi:hypothetical protein